MRILIAEDDLNSRKLIKAILSDYGECETAVDGEKAINAFRGEADAYIFKPVSRQQLLEEIHKLGLLNS